MSKKLLCLLKEFEKSDVYDVHIVNICMRITAKHKQKSKQVKKEKQGLSNGLDNELYNKDKCYICKVPLLDVQIICSICTVFNNLKRNQTKLLVNKVALVTGGRIKIGFYTALKLLRSGVRVIVTTRFGDDALKRYGAEIDYSFFKDSLDVVECDFTCLKDVNRLISYIKTEYVRIDYLINNAAQTIYRPREFYKYIHNSSDGSSNCSSQLSTYFPPGFVDEHNQQIDLRPVNSWVEKIEDVNIYELVEVLTINTIVPFYITQQLLPCLKSEKGKGYSYVINVSSMEGKFSRYKASTHPHTNMAKASLNMMTRTCGIDLKKNYKIIMVSVDTGWNTIEEPLSYDIKAPLDCIDGAARILDPIYSGLKHPGIFYKDFVKTTW